MDFFKLIPTSGSEVFLTDIYGTYNKFLIGVLVITLIAFIANLQLNWLLNFNLKSLINKTPTPAEFHSFTQAPIMGGMPPIIAKNLTDMAMRRLRNYAINNIVLPAANPGARIILNNLGPTPQMPSINNALTRSSMNRGTILSPNFSTAQSLSNIQQIAASHNTSMENAARLIDRHIQEAVRTLWAMFILLAVNSLLIVYFLGCLLHINEFTNNRYRYLVWLFPSRTVAARPSQIIEIEEDEESSMSTATDVNYTTLEDMRARAESYWGTPSDETETSSSVEEDVSSSTLSEDETQSPTRSNTSEVGTQTDPIEENISSDELPASDNLSKVPKDNGPGSDSQQGGGGSSSAMTINNLTIEEPSYGPNYEQDWPEILEEIIRDLLGLIPELANLPFLVLIY
ncbi:MAG: hypothetical protein EOP34_08565 [Rickettsiales bacterium]|nr:MAG: hypothetical protein EOP34_08565 [Rickettsiales bacterium]